MAAKKPGGLAGVEAGETAISTVGKDGRGLTYRGYAIEDLAEHGSFEETAYLLIRGKLPNVDELTDYRRKLAPQAGCRTRCGASWSCCRRTRIRWKCCRSAASRSGRWSRNCRSGRPPTWRTGSSR